MVHKAIVLVVCLTFFTPVFAGAAEPFRWRKLGEDPLTVHPWTVVEKTFRSLPADVRADIARQIRESRIDRDLALKDIAAVPDSDLPKDRKEAATKCLMGYKPISVSEERLVDCLGATPLGMAVAQALTAKYIKKMYEVVGLENGSMLSEMGYGNGKLVGSTIPEFSQADLTKLPAVYVIDKGGVLQPKAHLFKSKGKDDVTRVVAVVPFCENPAPFAVLLTPVAVAPAGSLREDLLAKTQYSLVINFLQDRKDGYWEERYSKEPVEGNCSSGMYRADEKQECTRYFRVFTRHPFSKMLQERKNRPIKDGRFYVKFLAKDPGDDLGRQRPERSNVLWAQEVKTGRSGYVRIPVTAPRDFAVVVIEAENNLDVVERFIWVQSRTFANQANPIHVWVIQKQ